VNTYAVQRNLLPMPLGERNLLFDRNRKSRSLAKLKSARRCQNNERLQTQA